MLEIVVTDPNHPYPGSTGTYTDADSPLENVDIFIESLPSGITKLDQFIQEMRSIGRVEFANIDPDYTKHIHKEVLKGMQIAIADHLIEVRPWIDLNLSTSARTQKAVQYNLAHNNNPFQLWNVQFKTGMDIGITTIYPGTGVRYLAHVTPLDPKGRRYA